MNTHDCSSVTPQIDQWVLSPGRTMSSSSTTRFNRGQHEALFSCWNYRWSVLGHYIVIGLGLMVQSSWRFIICIYSAIVSWRLILYRHLLSCGSHRTTFTDVGVSRASNFFSFFDWSKTTTTTFGTPWSNLEVRLALIIHLTRSHSW